MGTYDSSGGDYATHPQKDSLEDLMLYIAFQYGLLQLRRTANTTEATTLWVGGSITPINLGPIASAPAKVTAEQFARIFYGHNQFSNKRCPCFQMKNALAGTLGRNLRSKLGTMINKIEFDVDTDGDSWEDVSSTMYYSLKPSTFLHMIAPAVNASPYEGTRNFDGVGEYVDSN
jgi:hypothetical protein